MKKIVLLTILGCAIFNAASYASTFMRVTQTDGSVVEFDVEKVTQVDYYKKNINAPSSHEYVDLGLPSGTLWAAYNVGAKNPEEYGDYFAWGEVDVMNVYDWSTYKYAKVTDSKDFKSISKYNISGYYGGIKDGLETILPEDDAATVNWGSEWRMPTSEEQRELLDECYVVWTKNYKNSNVGGVVVYKAKTSDDKGQFVGSLQTPSSKYDVASDAHIFLPQAGFRFQNLLDILSGTRSGDEIPVFYAGNYWSSSLNEYDETLAYELGFNSERIGSSEFYRAAGTSVRAVRTKTKDVTSILVREGDEYLISNASIGLSNVHMSIDNFDYSENAKHVINNAQNDYLVAERYFEYVDKAFNQGDATRNQYTSAKNELEAAKEAIEEAMSSQDKTVTLTIGNKELSIDSNSFVIYDDLNDSFAIASIGEAKYDPSKVLFGCGNGCVLMSGSESVENTIKRNAGKTTFVKQY